MLWWLIQNALGAAILAGGAALLSRATRLSPSARHALWLVVLVKLLAPPLPLWQCPWEGPVAGAVSPGTIAPTQSLSAATMLAGIWLAGAAAMATFQAARLLALHLRLRGASEAPTYLRNEAAILAAEIGVRLPRMVVARSIGSPLLIGGFHTRLVIPEALLDELDLASWRSVIAHELAHVKRRDHWTGWLELVGACAWWWNPVFWYAQRRLRENAEFACDAWVVRTLPDERRAYAASLITVVDTFAWKPASVAAIGMAAGGKRIFERRLEMILREAVPHRMSIPALVTAFAAALLVVPGLGLPTASAVEPISTPVVVEQQPIAVASAPQATTAPAVEVAPAKELDPVAAQPVTAKPKPQRASLRSAPKAEKRAAQKDRPAISKPASIEEAKEAKLEVAETSEAVRPSPKPNPSPLAAALKAPLRIDLSGDDESVARSGLQNVQVGGEIRIRYNRYSN